jgi:hypothetical protein
MLCSVALPECTPPVTYGNGVMERGRYGDIAIALMKSTSS